MIEIELVDVYDNGLVRPFAAEFLYGMLKARPAMANISHQQVPSFEAHLEYVCSRPYRCWYLVGKDNGWIGTVSATYANEIGIAIEPLHQRKGYGKLAVILFTAKHQPLGEIPGKRNGRWIANVAPDNEPSIAMFEKLGAKMIQVTFELTTP